MHRYADRRVGCMHNTSESVTETWLHDCDLWECVRRFTILTPVAFDCCDLPAVCNINYPAVAFDLYFLSANSRQASQQYLFGVVRLWHHIRLSIIKLFFSVWVNIYRFVNTIYQCKFLYIRYTAKGLVIRVANAICCTEHSHLKTVDLKLYFCNS